MKLKRHLHFSLGLQVLAASALLFSHLALTDIYHGERDTGLEWRILRLSALILVAALAESTWTLWRLRRNVEER